MAERVSGRKAAARRRVRRRRLLAGGAAVVALCLVGGAVALATGRKTGPTYRTATAAVGSVAQTLDAVGSVASATRYDTAFSVAGTVGVVGVSVGETVTAGKVLATLDTTALDEAVEAAESTLADAKQQLEDDRASQAAAATTAATAAATPAATAAATPAATASAAVDSPTGGAAPVVDPVAAAVAAVKQAQQALLAQYELTATALDASTTSVADSQSVCEVFLATSTDDPTATDDATPTDDPTPTDDATAAEALVACQQAISQVLADQKSVDTAQATLLTLAGALDDAVAAAQTAVTAAQAAVTAAQAAASATAGQATAGSTAGTATAAASGTGSQAGSTEVPSAATILADRAAITLDEARFSIAKNALTMVSLTSPIDGTVAAVSIAAGDTVSASSTSAVITVIGNDGYVVTTTVPLSEIDTVKVGQSAKMTVASASEALEGSVSSIGILNVSTSTSDPSYTVVIAVTATTERLFNGSSAQVTVTTSQQDATLTVPSSAVHVDGSTSTVQVLRAGKAVDVEVKTGAVGTELTEITSGLTKGAKVILADLSQELVSSDTSTTSGLTSLSGTTGQTGRMPVGGPGGAPPGS